MEAYNVASLYVSTTGITVSAMSVFDIRKQKQKLHKINTFFLVSE